MPAEGRQLEKLRQFARHALGSGEVSLVIGFAEGTVPGRAAPLFCTTPADADRLVFNGYCNVNLANYLTRPEVRAHQTVALVARHAVAKAVVGLVQESQVDPARVRLIAIHCPDLDGLHEDVAWTVVEQLQTLDEYLPAAAHLREQELTPERFAAVAQVDAKASAQRWDHFARQFDRCIKCYACRNVCPLCYCERCIADKNQPQWIDTSSTQRGNFAWNLVRAFHLAGRCVDCGACERACPMDLPLMELNRKMKQVVAERFGYVAGYEPKAEPPLATFNKDDPEEFIK
jgi:ferredoxin